MPSVKLSVSIPRLGPLPPLSPRFRSKCRIRCVHSLAAASIASVTERRGATQRTTDSVQVAQQQSHEVTCVLSPPADHVEARCEVEVDMVEATTPLARWALSSQRPRRQS